MNPLRSLRSLRRGRALWLGVPAMILAGAGLVGGTAGATAHLAGARPGPPTLSTVPTTALAQAGVILTAPPADAPWCGMVKDLPRGRNRVAGVVCPAQPSQAAASQTVAANGRILRQIVLADCTLPRALISHRTCWVAAVGMPRARVPALPMIQLGAAAKGPPMSFATLDFLDARSNQVIVEAYLYWNNPATAPATPASTISSH